MCIKVEVKNEILGDSVFWEGPAESVQDIRNIPARETARLVVQDGRNRVSGMWHVSAFTDAGEPLSEPPAAMPGERLVTFLKANASIIRPLSVGGTIQPHGIPRAEWERRFRVAIIAQAGLTEDDDIGGVVAAEMEGWPEKDEQPEEGFDPDWMTELPESAVAQNLSNWTA